MLIITPLTALTGDTDGVGSAAAQLLWRTDCTPIELPREAAQRVACDATPRHVLVDHADVLGVGATHPNVSTKLRAALEVRDGGWRFTASPRRPRRPMAQPRSTPIPA